MPTRRENWRRPPPHSNARPHSAIAPYVRSLDIRYSGSTFDIKHPAPPPVRSPRSPRLLPPVSAERPATARPEFSKLHMLSGQHTRALGPPELSAIEHHEATLNSLPQLLCSARRVRGPYARLDGPSALSFQQRLIGLLIELRRSALAVVEAATRWRAQPEGLGGRLVKCSGTLRTIPEPFVWQVQPARPQLPACQSAS